MSQYLANFYLGVLDRHLLETVKVRSYVRYMDDFVLWADSRHSVVNAAQRATEFLQDQLSLKPKRSAQVNTSDHGVTLCGYRVFPGTIRLAASRRERFVRSISRWERLWRCGSIDSLQLQRGVDAALGTICHADFAAWLRSLELNRIGWYHDV